MIIILLFAAFIVVAFGGFMVGIGVGAKYKEEWDKHNK